MEVGLGFYGAALAGCALNAAAIGLVVRGLVRSTPLFHTAVMLASWALYQAAFRLFTDQRTATSPPPPPLWPACGFCPRSLRFDPGDNSLICTGFGGSVQRWMVLPWQFPWTGGNATAVAGTAVVGGYSLSSQTVVGEAARYIWWPMFAGCIVSFAVGAFADVIRRVMRIREPPRHFEFAGWAQHD